MNQQRIFEEESFRIEVSEDVMTAALTADTGAKVCAADVITKLKEIGITGFDDGEIIQTLTVRKDEPVSLVVARGKPPVDPRPGKTTFHLPTASGEQGLVAKVIAGQLIATIIPSTGGADGLDVFGQSTPFKKLPEIQAGKGVSLSKCSLMATANGNLREKSGVVTVHPLMEVYADDDLLKSSVNFDGDVAIRSTLPDGRNLELTGCLTVGGAVDAAVFKAGGWVHVKGGIIGREKGSGVVGGDLWCRFMMGAKISAGGDIFVQGEVSSSIVACTGRLTLAHGTITGGRIVANGGVSCSTLGNPAGTPTVIEAGTDHVLRKMLMDSKTEMETSKKRITEIREKVAPLMKHVKTLSPQQKEKATELLYEADELEERVKSRRESLFEPCRMTTLKACPEVIVSELIHPGVTIRFPGVETVIGITMQGPAKIFPRKIANVTEIVVEESNGEVTPLATTQFADPFRACVDRLIAERLAA